MALERVGLGDPRLDVFSGMTDAQLKDCATPRAGRRGGAFENLVDGLFVAESKNVILRALEGCYQPFSLFMEERWVEHEMPLIERVLDSWPEVPVLVVSHEDFRELTGYQVTRGALAAFHRKTLPQLPELLQNARRVCVIEDVTNYGNIGAIFRSAAGLGVDAILVTPGCHDPFYRRAARVSMGAVFQVPWTRIGEHAEWAPEGVELLHEMGFAVVALALEEDSIRLQDPRVTGAERLAFVMGTEGEGLRPSTIAACDHTVMIPMRHEVDSLNVAAASAVVFWELCARE